jgi:hypothetical protein
MPRGFGQINQEGGWIMNAGVDLSQMPMAGVRFFCADPAIKSHDSIWNRKYNHGLTHDNDDLIGFIVFQPESLLVIGPLAVLMWT